MFSAPNTLVAVPRQDSMSPARVIALPVWVLQQIYCWISKLLQKIFLITLKFETCMRECGSSTVLVIWPTRQLYLGFCTLVLFHYNVNDLQKLQMLATLANYSVHHFNNVLYEKS